MIKDVNEIKNHFNDAQYSIMLPEQVAQAFYDTYVAFIKRARDAGYKNERVDYHPFTMNVTVFDLKRMVSLTLVNRYIPEDVKQHIQVRKKQGRSYSQCCVAEISPETDKAEDIIQSVIIASAELSGYKTKKVTNLEPEWRTPNPQTIRHEDSRLIWLRHLRSGLFMGFCLVEPDGTVVQQGFETPGADAFFLVHAIDHNGRKLYFLLQDGERYLLARKYGQKLKITNEERLFTDGRNPLKTSDISIDDLDCVRHVITDALEHGKD